MLAAQPQLELVLLEQPPAVPAAEQRDAVVVVVEPGDRGLEEQLEERPPAHAELEVARVDREPRLRGDVPAVGLRQRQRGLGIVARVRVVERDPRAAEPDVGGQPPRRPPPDQQATAGVRVLGLARDLLVGRIVRRVGVLLEEPLVQEPVEAQRQRRAARSRATSTPRTAATRGRRTGRTPAASGSGRGSCSRRTRRRTTCGWAARTRSARSPTSACPRRWRPRSPRRAPARA